MCVECRKKATSLSVPNRKLSEVKAAVDKQLLNINTFTSFSYLLRDIAMSIMLVIAVDHLDRRIAHATLMAPHFEYALKLLGVGIWSLYLWFQSLVFTGLWILAHECGHEAFSSSTLVCDSVGFVLHTALGTPYFSWKYSHKLHHRFNQHMEKDQHMIPILKGNKHDNSAKIRRYRWHSFVDSIEDTPIFLLLKISMHQILGFHFYIWTNVSGQAHYPWWTSHLNPWSPMFQRKHLTGVLLSDAGIVSWISILFTIRDYIGLKRTLLLYVFPWLLLSHWITMIVYLQHTDPMIPHYRAKDWKYVPAQLATIDRDFLGWQGRFFLHSISSTHVVHHIFPKLPFYHAEEATEQLKSFLGADYNYCNTKVFRALWDNITLCAYVDDDDHILYFRDKNGNLMKDRCTNDKR